MHLRTCRLSVDMTGLAFVRRACSGRQRLYVLCCEEIIGENDGAYKGERGTVFLGTLGLEALSRACSRCSRSLVAMIRVLLVLVAFGGYERSGVLQHHIIITTATTPKPVLP
jgi:hypothetical protein